MTRKLILVGGIHTDVEGESRLVRAIEQFRPSDLSVEALEDSVQFSQRTIDGTVGLIRDYRGLALSDDNLERFAKYLGTYGSELKVAEAMKRKWTPKVYLVDTFVPKTKLDPSDISSYLQPEEKPDIIREMDEWRHVLFMHLTQGIKLSNSIAALLSTYLALAKYDDSTRARIDEYRYSSSSRIRDKNMKTETEMRDTHMERRIRELWYKTGRTRGAGDFMHFGGVLHIFGEYHNLFERLRDLNPVRYKLNEFG
ncbi:MAG: hypothetical protein AABX33_03970 [Nanoarchaeota archaeon]